MPSVGVFAAIFDEQRRILCVRQNYGPRKWTLPGGKMEAGESPF
jgi:8-oxo-dGTP diphosphatase